LTDGGTATATAQFTIDKELTLEETCATLLNGLAHFSPADPGFTQWSCSAVGPDGTTSGELELAMHEGLAALSPYCPVGLRSGYDSRHRYVSWICPE
jgi:hypothetical protein